jgi:hypothetical protein
LNAKIRKDVIIMVRGLNESNDSRIQISSFWDLRNADALRNEIIEKLKKFDKDMNQYQTDVYLYVQDDMTGELYDFVNVGGNSWLNDDHYFLFADHQHYGDWTDYWQTEGEIADALSMTLDDLKQEVLDNWNDQDYDLDDVGFSDITEYINFKRDDYLDTLYQIYYDAVDNDFESEYSDETDKIIEDFDNNLVDMRDY